MPDFEMELEPDDPKNPGQLNARIIATRRDDSDYIDRRLTAVGYSIYLGGYHLYCDGMDQPIFLAYEFVDFGLTNVASIDDTVHADYDAAVHAIPMGPPTVDQPTQYAYFRGAGGKVIAPTVFCPVTTPRCIDTISTAIELLVDEVTTDLTILALSLIGGMVLQQLFKGIIRAAEGKFKGGRGGKAPGGGAAPEVEPVTPARRPPTGWPKDVDFKLVQEVLEGTTPASRLSRDQAAKAAKFYDDVAQRVVGSKAADAKAYNVERARFLKEGTGTPPGKLKDFMARRGK